jgi:hypothetical protein
MFMGICLGRRLRRKIRHLLLRRLSWFGEREDLLAVRALVSGQFVKSKLLSPHNEVHCARRIRRQVKILEYAPLLYVFGFGKYWVLNGNGRNVNTNLWEGGQIVVLGSVAALAAVLYVRPFDGKLLQ